MTGRGTLNIRVMENHFVVPALSHVTNVACLISVFMQAQCISYVVKVSTATYMIILNVTKSINK